MTPIAWAVLALIVLVLLATMFVEQIGRNRTAALERLLTSIPSPRHPSQVIVTPDDLLEWLAGWQGSGFTSTTAELMRRELADRVDVRMLVDVVANPRADGRYGTLVVTVGMGDPATDIVAVVGPNGAELVRP